MNIITEVLEVTDSLVKLSLNMFKDEILSYKNEIINDLINLININTVNDTRKPNMPFGEGVYKGLKYVLEVGNTMNFKYQNYCGYCGQLEVGEGPYTVGIICNVDVKRPEEGWTKAPFVGQVEDNKIYGKGALKGKGSLIACLYALKVVNEAGLIPKGKKVRIVVACDKEIGFKSINYYKEYEESHEIGFTPDGRFPVIFGEKGTINLELEMNAKSNFEAPINIVQIQGGGRVNEVPETVNIILSCDDMFKEQITDALKEYSKENKIKYQVSCQNKLMSIDFKGKTAPSHRPEKGINAVSHGINFLSLFEEFIDRKDFVNEYEKLISTDCHGERINCFFEDKDSGKLTFNVSSLELINDKAIIKVDIRFPITAIYSEVHDLIINAFKYSGFEIKDISHIRPVCFSEDSFVVKKLAKVYRDVTGDVASPCYTTEGTSYARVMSNTVAFGPENKEFNLLKENDEYISVDYLLQLTEIYANAILELLK